jgi:CHAT domain-containing protein
MVRFYRHLNNPALGKAQALRQAQLEMIRSGDYSHPYYWAGFVLTGKP